MRSSPLTQHVPTFSAEVDSGRLTLSARAASALRGIFRACDDPEVLGVRLFVSGSGCSGMSYTMTFTDRQLPYDRVLRADDFDIYVDALAFGYLDGASIDYEERDHGSAFVFHGVFKATGGSGLCGGCAGAVSPDSA